MENKQIKGKYEFSNDFKTHYSNGVIGGLLNGELVMNFYHEINEFGPNFEITLKEDSYTEKLEDPSILTRHISTRIVMKKETAKLLADWIYSSINNAEKESGEDTNE